MGTIITVCGVLILLLIGVWLYYQRKLRQVFKEQKKLVFELDRDVKPMIDLIFLIVAMAIIIISGCGVHFGKQWWAEFQQQKAEQPKNKVVLTNRQLSIMEFAQEKQIMLNQKKAELESLEKQQKQEFGAILEVCGVEDFSQSIKDEYDREMAEIIAEKRDEIETIEDMEISDWVSDKSNLGLYFLIWAALVVLVLVYFSKLAQERFVARGGNNLGYRADDLINTIKAELLKPLVITMVLLLAVFWVCGYVPLIRYMYFWGVWPWTCLIISGLGSFCCCFVWRFSEDLA